jgi:ribosome-associated protein
MQRDYPSLIWGCTATGRRAIHDEHEIATVLAQAALDMKAFDVVILDLTGLVAYTDLFVICSARNRRQVQAVADELRSVAKKDLSLHAKSTEGVEAARWVLVDFGGVVVHVFDEALRGFYDLDGLWADAPRLPTPESEGPSESRFSV